MNNLFELMEGAWIFAIAFFVLLTMPIWVLPYAAFKCWKAIRARGNNV